MEASGGDGDELLGFCWDRISEVGEAGWDVEGLNHGGVHQAAP
jgi:hypothetical protein